MLYSQAASWGRNEALKIKTEFQEKMDRTQTDVGQITCWCITIALHQEFGVGRSRLDRIADCMGVLEDNNAAVMLLDGAGKADMLREKWFDGICDPHFRVPLLRAPRGRKEQQLTMAGNQAASIAWQIYAKACIDVLGYGSQRLERLKTESWKNYEQFNGWAHNDGIDVALEKLKRCAEAAMQEELIIMADDTEQDREVHQEIRHAAELQARLCLSGKAARKLNPQPRVAADMMSPDMKKVCDKALRETMQARRFGK